MNVNGEKVLGHESCHKIQECSTETDVWIPIYRVRTRFLIRLYPPEIVNKPILMTGVMPSPRFGTNPLVTGIRKLVVGKYLRNGNPEERHSGFFLLGTLAIL